jgi:hypothetical protein
MIASLGAIELRKEIEKLRLEEAKLSIRCLDEACATSALG